MRNFIAAAIIALAVPAQAEDTAIRDVIEQQIEAFRSDDMPRAFSFASPTLQDIFQTPRIFGLMVLHGYPMIRDPDRFRFLDLRTETDGLIWQRLELVDAGGQHHLLDYQMIETDGGWRIHAVRIVRLPGVTA